jgi:hypothetical protein
MSEGGKDPVALAVARLEVAVERLVLGLSRNPGGLRAAAMAGGETRDAPALRAEVAALAARLDNSIARLRDVVRVESEPGPERQDRGEEE